MLQEKEHEKLKKWCIKLFIILWVLTFLLYSWLIVFIIFILFVFFIWNKKTMWEYDIWKILKSIWVYDCVKLIFWNIDFESLTNKKDSPFWNKRNDYLERMNQIIKEKWERDRKRQEELRKQKEEELMYNKEAYYKKIDKTKIISKKEVNSDYKKTISSNSSSTFNSKHSYNDWKSIWDDYESVIDTMKKK